MCRKKGGGAQSPSPNCNEHTFIAHHNNLFNKRHILQ